MTFKNFLEASSFYSFATFVPAIANFLLLPVFASYLAPSDFGIFEIYIIISTFLVASSRFGMPGSITRLFIDLNEKADENSFIKTVSISTFASSVLLSLILYFLYGFYNGFANSENNFYYYLILVLAGTSAKAFYEILVKLLQVQEQPKTITLLSLSLFSLSAIMKLYLIIHLGLGFQALVLAEFISNFLSMIIAIFFLRNYLKGRISYKHFKK